MVFQVGRGYRHGAHSAPQVITSRYVTLGNGRRVGLGSYVAAWRACLAADPAQPIRMDLTGLPGSTAADVLRQFRDGMHDRINRHVPGYGIGRKWSPDWQREAIHFAHDINTPRLIVRYLPKDFRGPRFMHRLPDDAPAPRYATNRPGDAAAIYAAETGVSYARALVATNTD